MREDLATWQETIKRSSHQLLLTAQEILDRNLEPNVIRSGIDVEIEVAGPGILNQHRTIECPIRMIMAISIPERPRPHNDADWSPCRRIRSSSKVSAGSCWRS